MDHPSEPPPETEPRRQALSRLLTRIGANSDFPSLQESITSIQRIVRSEQAHMRALTEGVLQDVALTAKLLRLINAACYRSAGAGQITSVQRALSLLGFQAVGMMAASLILFEKLPRGLDGVRVRQDFSHALLAGLLAQELCHRGRDLEHSYLAGLFQNLGRMLVSLHFPEAAQTIDEQTRAALATRGIDAEGPRAQAERERIARAVLGLTTEDLGIEVATQWGWPETLRDTLRRCDPSPHAGPVAEDQYLRALATAACDLSAQLHRVEAQSPGAGPEAAAQRSALVDAFVARSGGPLALERAGALVAVERARAQWQSLAEMLGLDAVLGRQRARLSLVGARGPGGASPPRGAPSPLPSAPIAPKSPPMDAPTPATTPCPDQPEAARPAAAAGASVEPERSPASQPPRDEDTNLDQLAHTLERTSAHALSSAPMAEVARRALDDLREALQLQRAVLCLRTPEGRLQGRFGSGLGSHVQSRRLLESFNVPLGHASDLFSVLCLHARDTLISDATQPNIAERLPTWYWQHFGAPTFVVLPMTECSRVLGLLYGDRSAAGSLQLDESQLALLGALRNQLLVAIRLRSAGG